MKKLKTFENVIKLEGETKKKKLIRYLKFFLLPFYRAHEINKVEYEIGKIRSKRTFFRRFLSPLTIIGMACILFIVWCAIFPDWASKFTFDDIAVWVNTDEIPYTPPSPEHPFGIGESGWDILARNIWGTRFSLQVAFLAVVISFVLGTIVGIISAYAGGWFDNVIMRVVDIFSVFPALILAFIFITMWGNQMSVIMIGLGLAAIPSYARISRASTLQEKARLYVDAAKTSGASRFKVMFKHILPNAVSPLIVRVSFHIAVSTLTVGGLAFLGFAVSDVPTWGWDINQASGHMYRDPYAMFWPGMWIVITALGFQLVGDGLRDALDPKLKKLLKG